MFERNEKSNTNIEKLYHLIENCEKQEDSDYYTYKLFMLLLYLDRKKEAFEIADMIKDSSIVEVIRMCMNFLDAKHETLKDKVLEVDYMCIDAIKNHHRYLMSYIKAMYYFNMGEFEVCARLLLEIITTCNIDEILVEVVISDFIIASSKCKNNNIFLEFYADYYKTNKSHIPDTLVEKIENTNNVIETEFSTLDELLELYSKFSDSNLTVREYLYELWKQIETFFKFDLSYMIILDRDNPIKYEYRNDKVIRKFTSLGDIKNTIYERLIHERKPIIKKIDDESEFETIHISCKDKPINNYFIVYPIIDKDSVIAAFTFAGDEFDLTDSVAIIEKISDILKVKILDRLAKQVAYFNEQVVEVLDHLADGYLIETGGILKLSKGAQKTFGIKSDILRLNEALGKVEIDSADKIRDVLSRDLARDSVEVENKSGDVYLCDVQKIKLESGKLARFALINDLTVSRNTLMEYESLAYVDGLTGLGNYNALMKAYDNINVDDDATFINFDINKFKMINDSFGHDVGDRALKFFARAVKTVFSKLNGQVFRKSGDEFIVILDEYIKKEEKFDAMNELSRYLDETSNYPSNLPTMLKYSAGIASTHATKRGKEDLFKYADLAMYESKQTNDTSTYIMFDDEHLQRYEQEERKALYLKDAIKNETIELYYDEIVHLDGSVQCYKLGVRAPKIDLVNDELAAFADTQGLLLDLDMAIARKVSNDQKRFIDELGYGKNIHAPVTVNSLVKPLFYDYITELIEKNNMNPNTVTMSVVNLTDSENFDITANILNKYVDYGFNLSIDFTKIKMPYTSYFSVVKFKYFNVPAEMIDILSSNKNDRKHIHELFIFNALKEIDTEPIIEGVDDKKVYDALVQNGINYYTRYGTNSEKNIGEVIKYFKTM